jgi:hypothetical protein
VATGSMEYNRTHENLVPRPTGAFRDQFRNGGARTHIDLDARFRVVTSSCRA